MFDCMGLLHIAVAFSSCFYPPGRSFRFEFFFVTYKNGDTCWNHVFENQRARSEQPTNLTQVLPAFPRRGSRSTCRWRNNKVRALFIKVYYRQSPALWDTILKQPRASRVPLQRNPQRCLKTLKALCSGCYGSERRPVLWGGQERIVTCPQGRCFRGSLGGPGLCKVDARDMSVWRCVYYIGAVEMSQDSRVFKVQSAFSSQRGSVSSECHGCDNSKRLLSLPGSGGNVMHPIYLNHEWESINAKDFMCVTVLSLFQI